MSDTVTLSFPRDPRYYGVARLVVGGMAAPLQMSFDVLDDLQLAISSLLDHEDLAMEGELQLRLDIDGDRLTATLGTFAAGSVAAALERSVDGESGALSLRRLLDTIVDDVRVSTDAASGGDRVLLAKRVGVVA